MDRAPALVVCLMLLAAGVAGCAKPVVSACYTPGGNCSSAIVAEIGAARSEVLVQAYALTSGPITDALVQAREAGAHIAIILDRSHPFAQNSALYLSSLRGLPTFVDSQHGIADNNIMIIDKSTVITGSMAFTAEAEERNAENVVFVRSADVARSYIENWSMHKAHAEEFVKIAEPQKEQAPVQMKADKKKTSKGKKKKKAP